MSNSDSKPPPSTASIFANAAKSRRKEAPAKPGAFTLVCDGCGAPRIDDDALTCKFCGNTLTPKTAS